MFLYGLNFGFAVVKSSTALSSNLIGIPLALVDLLQRQTKAFRVLFTTANWIVRLLVNFKPLFDPLGESLTEVFRFEAVCLILSSSALLP